MPVRFCFVGSTKIALANLSEKPISQLKADDVVFSVEEKFVVKLGNNLREDLTNASPVTMIYNNPAPESLMFIKPSVNSVGFISTSSHNLYNYYYRGFTPVNELNSTSILLVLKFPLNKDLGFVEITRASIMNNVALNNNLKNERRFGRVYNLELLDKHTYFANGVLVLDASLRY